MNFQNQYLYPKFFIRGLVLLACLALALPVMAGHRPWFQRQKITSTPPGVGAEFGNAVAISGNTMVVGAHKTNPPSQAGAAFVYELNGTTWTEKAKLVAGVSPAANDHFGYSVAISGETIVVGAPSNFGFPNPGSAYVFVRNSMTMTWEEQQKLTGGKAGDEFGQSVAIQANTLVVGARYVDLLNPITSQFETDAGSAYIYRRSSNVWTPMLQQLIPRATAAPSLPGSLPPTIAADRFGESVAINGNFIAVGAAGDDDPQGAAGAVYVFVFNQISGNYDEQKKITITSGKNGDHFGHSVALEGNTLVAGAPYEPNISPTLATSKHGAAYVFEFNNAAWSSPVKLFASDGLTNDLFGWSVAVSSNVIAVGARDDTTALSSIAGSAYVFRRSGTTWNEIQKLVPADRASGDRFGESVALSLGNLVVGAALKAIPNGQGAAYYFTENRNRPIFFSITTVAVIVFFIVSLVVYYTVIRPKPRS